MVDDEEGPEFEVWNHMASGWQQAYDDMARWLDSDSMDLFQLLASIVVGDTSAFHLDRQLIPIRQKLEQLAPGLDASKYDLLFAGLLELYQRGRNPWLKHAVELELAGEGVRRSNEALERFSQLVPQLNQGSLPPKAEPYIQEAIQTYLFGFDAACIALCRGALEHAAKTVLVQLGVYTAPGLKREQPSLETLVTKLKQAQALEKALVAADRIRDRGNTVLHKHLFDPKVRRQVALDTIADLAAVLREILP